MIQQLREHHRTCRTRRPARGSILLSVLLAAALSAATFVQAADTEPPTITVRAYGWYPVVQDGMTITDGMLRFQADVYDASNIYTAPTLTLDGTPLPASIGHPEPGDDGEGDWDWTTWWVSYSGPIAGGSHTLVLTATDSVGNTAAKTFRLTVASQTTITEFAPVTYGANLRPVISARVNTGLSAGSIVLTVDGKTVAPAYDAATGRVTYTPAEDLADETYHTVVLTVADKSQLWQFYTSTYPDMADSNIGSCTPCHVSYGTAEWAWGSTFTPLPWEGVHAARVRFGGVWHESGGSDCGVCHKEGGASGIEVQSQEFTFCGQCHGRPGDWLGYGSGWYHGQHESITYAPYKRDPTVPIRIGQNRETVDCIVCHQPGVSMLTTAGTEVPSHDVPELHKTALPDCTECHAQSLAREHARADRTTSDGRPVTCSTCHLSSALEVVGAIATGNTDCFGCHSEGSHPGHSAATPGSGSITVFPDDGHDDAGWRGERPYFAVTVECTICHTTDLPRAHGNHCATCHPSPQDTLGTWTKGCQQGGCHPSYHADSTKSHAPFEDAYDEGNDCSRCHGAYWQVAQASCLNCHSAYVSEDVTPPSTASNAQTTYVGPARIEFSITDNGKVGVGRTFYKLDGGAVTAAGKNLFVVAPGSHTLEFWSKDQAGNTEPVHQTASFTVIADTTPPETTSDARASYYNGAVIRLSASDASTLGVKATYYRLNGGPAQTGTRVVLPATSGTISYSLAFWSEDWSGNVESPKTVGFTVSSGGGTLRLIWGDSDVSGSPCSYDPEANARWTVRSGEWGPVVASGAGGCPSWSGVADLSVPLSTTPYSVVIDWWDSWEGYYEQTYFPSVVVTAPGQVVRLVY
ncbi:MAG: hypothetical protein HY900_16065 [Deltaproteobacteria bacterium]|nr:hypothetical protein [Deltaproteobacteria bacterium]